MKRRRKNAPDDGVRCARAALTLSSFLLEGLYDVVTTMKATLASLVYWHGHLKLATAGPQLSGVMHAGGVLSDALIQNQTTLGMRAVFAPKVNGTANIMAYIAPAAVQAVKLFSSVAARLGSGGQGNYAAANAVMDAWAGQGQDQVIYSFGKHPNWLLR